MSLVPTAWIDTLRGEFARRLAANARICTRNPVQMGVPLGATKGIFHPQLEVKISNHLFLHKIGLLSTKNGSWSQ